ncbi:amino acid adenylation domain-containing protein [Cladophialophora immunda]|nr:amino acid adenylation domain-containing protein [Cladophialophora immunda]
MPSPVNDHHGVDVSHNLSIVNENRQILPGPQSLHELIATPSENVVLDFLLGDGGRVILTYREFHRLADLLSRDIQQYVSFREGGSCIIPIIIPQSPEFYVALVAVLKSGAAFCPISQDVPPERLKFILQDTQATFVLATTNTRAAFGDALSDVQCKTVSLGTLQKRSNSAQPHDTDHQHRPGIHPSSPAYIMYTSGSTGLPKGVVVSHFSVSQSLLAHDEHIPRFKRFLQFASPTFDVSIFEIFFPFFRGATLAGCDREQMLIDLPATIRMLDADAAELTPTVAGTLLRTRKAAPCLKTLLTIGEMLTASVVSEFGGSADQSSMLYAMYGPTEAAIHCTVAPQLAADASVRSIGRPLATVTAFVLKEREPLEIAPIGESGELAVAGQLADGYLNRPEQNQAAFVELAGYGPIYKTGDRAICRPDGELEILGRMTSGQVKLRGQRVELGEIEEIASKTDGVHLAIASIIDDVLVLFCAAKHDVTVPDVSAQCKSWLPPYMRPGEIVLLYNDVPRLPSGKIDRKALERNYRECRVPINQGTSFATPLEEDYSCVNATMISEADNVATLSSFIAKSEDAKNGRTEPEYETSDEWQAIRAKMLQDLSVSSLKTPYEKILPCSSMQVAMLIETATKADRNFNQIWLKLGPDLTLSDLRRAFEKLSMKNEILRSGFIETGIQEMPFAQIVWRDLPYDPELSLLHPLQLASSETTDERDVLVWIHHALYDGWSWDLILDDLNAILSEEDAPRRTQFSDFRSHEHSRLRSEKVGNFEYWRTQLQEFKPSPFPIITPVRSKSPRKTTTEFPLSTTYEQLSHFASVSRCSRETVLEAAWSLLLSSYLDNADVAVGVVVAGRHFSLAGIESVIGPCLSLFPLRVDTSALRTVHDVLNHVQRQRTQTLRHGSIALRDINNAAGLRPGDKLFDTLCVWQQDSEENRRDRTKVATLRTHDALEYAIVLEFEPRQGQVHLKLTFDTALVPEDHAMLLTRQLDTAASRIMSNLDLSLNCFWESFDKNTLSLANTRFQNFSGDFDLTTTISELAESCPERAAVEFVHSINERTSQVEKETLTYSDLYKRARIVGSVLRTEYNVQIDDLVCIIGSRSTLLYIGILGTIMAGGAYICIDPRTPAARVRQILAEARCRLTLSTEHVRETEETDGPTSISIASLLEHHSARSICNNPSLKGDQLAYAVFTSGSTGVPKGVLLSRRNLLSNLEELSRIYPCDPETDRLLQACSPAFDVSVFEIFWAWYKGMTLCTASNDVLFRDLQLFINQLDITHLSMTPSVASLVRPDNIPHVKMLVTAGEPMNSKVFSDWAEHGLYQGYGPSETTNICNVRPQVSKSDILNNVGPPLPNTSVFICQRQESVDQSFLQFRPLLKGGAGEIWIGGEQVGRGYLDQVLTSKSFFDHPEYGRLYRSGDIGRLLCDDSLVILGREDDQVKIRGQRIELGEVNSALIKCNEVEDAVSLVIDKGDDTSRLVAFWTPRQSHRSTIPDGMNISIFETLANSLPDYMIPESLIQLDKIPLTRQGKVNRADLINYYRNLDVEQLQAMSRGSKLSESVDRLSDSECIIARVVADALGVSPAKINRSTSFYSLGLDSISAIRVSRALRDHYPVVEISSLMKNPSVGQLMRHIERHVSEQKTFYDKDDLGRLFKKWEGQVRGLYSRAGLEVDRILPCTPLQESMVTSSMDASSRVYRNTLRFKVCGNMSTLRQAWELAVARHQILRTGFAVTDSSDSPFVQVVLKNFQLPWLEEGTKHLSYALDGLMIPPWSLEVRESTELILKMHHGLYDAEAMAVLLSEIQSLYHGRQLPPTTPFDSYLSFMEASNTGGTYNFWRTKLQGASLYKLSEAILPEDKAAPDTHLLVERRATIGVSELQRRARKILSTPLALFQAPWCRLLSCVFESQDICFGNVLSGRNLPIDGVESMVAPCFNTIPARIQLQPDESNQELCHCIQQMNVETLPYQSSSLRQIQRAVDTQGRALFDTLILLQQDELRLDNQVWTLVEDSGDMSFPFILEITMNSNADTFTLKLHSEVAERKTLGKFLDVYDALLSHTAKYPQARALDYSFIAGMLPRVQPSKPLIVLASSAAATPIDGQVSVDEDLSRTETLVKDILVKLRPDALPKIFRDTTVFSLGFDSINAVQIAAKLRKRGFDISTGAILEAASVRNIASICDSGVGKGQIHRLFDLGSYEESCRRSICQNNSLDEFRVQSVWPCTPIQSGILSQFLRSNYRLYFNHMHFKLDNDVDLSRLRRAWSLALQSHAMLRTGFAETDDPKTPFVMIIYRPDAVQLPWADDSTQIRQGKGEESSTNMRSLTQPPWHIRVSKTGSSSTLELSMVHALYDAQSLDIILGDVARSYAGLQLPSIVPLAPVVSKILGLSRDESSRAFWEKVSADMCLTRFPDLKVYNQETDNYRVATRQCSMSLKSLENACATRGATMQALAAAAWAVLLAAYTAQDHITFGVILSGRDFDEEENRVAFPCINTVPFAMRLSHDRTDLLQSAVRRCAGVLKHQHSPLSSIKRWVQAESDLFDTVIVLQKYEAEKGPDRPWALIKDNANAEYTISLELIPRENDALDLQVTFREAVIPPDQAVYVLQEFEELMKSLLTQATYASRLPQPVVSVVPAKEERIPSTVRYLHEFVELTAKEKPENTALEFVQGLQGMTPIKQVWSYAQLDSNGNKIARLIQSKGLQVGDLVAVCFDKCPEASFAILGVLKSGCGYIAIDPGAPTSRKEFILRDSGCEIVLTTDDKTSEFNTIPGVSALAIDNDSWQELSGEKPLLSKELHAQAVCYCLYTSGTTGTPKGCLISHDSAVQAMLSFQRIFCGRWKESSRWLQFASFHFDVSVLEQYWSWSVGIIVTSAPRDLLFEDLPGTINALEITHLDLTPSLARLLTPEDVPSLCGGVFIVGGEQVSQDILETWGDTGCLYNFYGPSEVTIGCTVHRQVPKHAKPTNIGQQWDNVGSFVLEPSSQTPVLRGAVGELCLSGPLVGKGYLNRPDLTKEKFVVLTEYGTRVYRTGDLVRLLHDDSFEFLGRIDDQVKLRGQRLEIGEINHIAMSADSKIRDVATMVLKHPTQQKDQLVTFFSTSHRRAKNEKPSLVATWESQDLATKIRMSCSDKLPAYMVPSYILAVSSLPLSVNNKVDHKSLKAMYEENLPGAAQDEPSGSYASSPEALQYYDQVASVLASFLRIQISDIKPTSRLFELGLDSISAIGLARALKRKGFQNAEVGMILKHSVVQDLARAIIREADSHQIQAVEIARKRMQSFHDAHYGEIARSMGVSPENIESIAPCTPLQEGMISRVMQSGLDDTVYFSCFLFELNPNTDIQRLKSAWGAVQRSISILRTYFVPTADGFAQVVLRKYDSAVNLIRYEVRNGGIRKLQDSSFKDWVGTVRSLSTSLPWKVELGKSGNGGFMILRIFHGLYDGNSLPILLKQVKQQYEHPEEVHNPKMQFYEALPCGPLCQLPDEREFWLSHLARIRPQKLPITYAEHETDTHCVVLRDHLSIDHLQTLCNELNVTVSAYFQATLLYVMAKEFNFSPTIGVVVSGRATAREEIEDVIGPMFNTIPCAINSLKDGAAVSDLVQACHQFNVDIIPYQHTPLRKIVQYLGLNASQALFDTLFVFQKASLDLDASTLWREVPTDSSPDYPLNIEVEQKGTEFHVTLIAKSQYLSTERASHLLNMYIDVVRRPEKMGVILPTDFCLLRDPETLNGEPKTDLSASDGVCEEDHDIALSPTETIIRSEIAKLASVEENRIHRHRPTIFELGLDSIEAMKLAARVKNSGLRVTVSAIMRSPTVAGIAVAATSSTETRARTTNGERVPSIGERQISYRHMLQGHGINLESVEAIFPVTPMQEGLLLESDKYLNVMTFKLNANIDIKRLVGAWEKVSQTEPILRTHFAVIDSSDVNTAFVQYVVKEGVEVTIFDDKKLNEVIRSLKNVPSEPTLADQQTSIALVREKTASFLVLAMPHALYDAWSLHLLRQEVTMAYQFPNSKIQGAVLRQYQEHLEEIISQAESAEARKFWESRLLHMQPTIFQAPIDDHRQQGVTLQTVGLTCWTIALIHYTCQLDVCFGLVLSGRTTEGSDRLIFPTFNTVAFRLLIEANMTKSQALQRVHDTVVRVSEYQHFPLIKALHSARGQGVNDELFNTLFTFQKLPTAEGDLPALWEEMPSDGTSITPPYPVNVELEGDASGLIWTIAFQQGVADEAFGQTLLSNLDTILAALMNNPDQILLREEGGKMSICSLPAVDLLSSRRDRLKTDSRPDEDLLQSQGQENWTPTETIIRDVLAKVSNLEKEQVKKNIGLFHLGLDSVSAIKVASLLRKEGVQLPVSQIIRAQTVVKMAVAAEQLKATMKKDSRALNGPTADLSIPEAVKKAIRIPEGDLEMILPCTAGQTYMLDMWSASNGHLFFPLFWLKVSGVSLECLKRALKKLVQEIPLLRTLFIHNSDGAMPKTFQVVVQNEAADKYDFPWAMRFDTTGNELLVALRIHHALYDAVGFQLFITRLERLCAGTSSQTQLHTDMSTLISSNRAARPAAEEFWSHYLGQGQGALRLLSRGSFAARRVEKFLPKLLPVDRLSNRLKYHGLSIQALFFAAYARIYRAIRRELGEGQQEASPGREDVVVGIYLANRSLDIDGIMELMAPTFSIVPLRVRSGQESLLQSALQIQYDLGEVTKPENCGVSMRDIYAWSGVKVDTFVNFLSLPDNAEEALPSGDPSSEIRVTHAEMTPEQKDRAQGLDAPSPFINGMEVDADTTRWCMPAIDIEAKVEDGYLDMGVFAPEDMLSEDEVTGMMDGMRNLMLDFS